MAVTWCLTLPYPFPKQCSLCPIAAGDEGKWGRGGGEVNLYLNSKWLRVGCCFDYHPIGAMVTLALCDSSELVLWAGDASRE